MKTIRIAAIMLLAATATTASAQDDAPKFKVNPTGRILMDGAAYAGPARNGFWDGEEIVDNFKDGVQIVDARLGVKASYGKWNAKVDIGFAYGKVGVKDVLMQYTFNDKNFLRGGYFIHQYGLQSATSSSMKPSMEEPTSNEVFNCGRQIGLMYEHSGKNFLGTFSVHTEDNAMKFSPRETNGQAVGVMSRLVYRAFPVDRVIAQVGFSGGFTTPGFNSADPSANQHHSFTFKGNFPTRVNKVQAIYAFVDDARNQFKFTPELLVAYGPAALESQYFFNRVNRLGGLHNFTGQGAYVALRGLLLGGDYGYAPADGGLATPKGGSLECVINYNYTTLTDNAAGIRGGRINDISCTFNYYINKYMIARLRAGYTHRWDRAGEPTADLTGIQARLQIIF